MHIAARKNAVDVFQFIIENVKDKNPENIVTEDEDNLDTSTTPFHIAARHGHLEICRIIVENIEDISPRDGCGFTPYDRALKSILFGAPPC